MNIEYCMMLIMKTFLLSCLLLGSGTLATTIPESASLIKDPEGPTDTPIPRLLRSINPEIRPSDLNKYLHPNAKYTSEGVDCADGEPILSEGQTIGCFFINEEEAIDRAVKAVAAAKNLGNPYVDETPSSSLGNRLNKRDYQYSSHHCFGSGVYTLTPDIRETHRWVCLMMDQLAGKYVAGASWTITQMLYPGNPSNIYAAGASNIQIRHDYFFQSMYTKDTWVHSSFNGQCKVYIERLFGFNGWNPLCIGGSGGDSRGGWLERYDDFWAYRRYRVGLDPNKINQDNS
ncbi:hypothetical protein TWF281_004617 [Arthrobotrys megalospora]